MGCRGRTDEGIARSNPGTARGLDDDIMPIMAFLDQNRRILDMFVME